MTAAPIKAAPRPMNFDACFERLTAWAMAYAVECEEDGIPGIVADVNRDQLFMRHELDWCTAMSDMCASGGLPERGVYVPRPDLALGALQVAVKADQLDVATCFAQTAIDFLTGTYDPENFDVESPA